MIRIALSALAVAGTVLALPVAAQRAPAAPQSSRAAALNLVRTEFAATDLDHDGTLSRAEVAARFDHMKTASAAHPLNHQQARQLTELWFGRTDTNHDGRITLAESEAMMMQTFDRYDTNHDGVISAAERAAARGALKAPSGQR
ncbi:MAG: EF-hand domain-containing protein [Janthinobacterium lividum]